MKTKLERIQNDIESLAQFSSVKGKGCTRFSYTKEFAQARDYIVNAMKEAGLAVREDPIGVVIGRMEGKNPQAPVIMTGSHFDTVKTGGRFDGTAGVVCALETARVLHEEGFVPDCPIEFVALPEEEGTRFGGGLTASRAMCGKLNDNELETYRDWDGISMADAMREYGLDPDKVDGCLRRPGELKAFLELHIEQGPILEKENTDIGIVDAIVGLRLMNVTVRGKSGHAGTTPLNMRADAALASAQAMVDATNKARSLRDGTVVTFGMMEVKPGTVNVIPYEANFSIDCRSKTMESVDTVLDEVRASLQRSVDANPGLSFEISEKMHALPVVMDADIRGRMKQQAEACGITFRDILSGAGHDTMIMASLTDVAMIFVKSKDGLSHVPEEWTDYTDLQNGIEVMCRTIEELAKE